MAYFANGTEGEVLDNQCSRCVLGQSACPIWLNQQMYNYEQIGNDLAQKIMDNLIDKDGKCQMLIQLETKDNLSPVAFFGDLGVEGNAFVNERLEEIKRRIKSRDFT